MEEIKSKIRENEDQEHVSIIRAQQEAIMNSIRALAVMTDMGIMVCLTKDGHQLTGYIPRPSGKDKEQDFVCCYITLINTLTKQLRYNELNDEEIDEYMSALWKTAKDVFQMKNEEKKSEEMKNEE